VEVGNTPALELYIREGYVISARKSLFYADGADAFEMCKLLSTISSESATVDVFIKRRQ
jgi:ribosomal protein S18 acetylase RimI-like enzyme